MIDNPVIRIHCEHPGCKNVIEVSLSWGPPAETGMFYLRNERGISEHLGIRLCIEKLYWADWLFSPAADGGFPRSTYCPEHKAEVKIKARLDEIREAEQKIAAAREAISKLTSAATKVEDPPSSWPWGWVKKEK